LSSRKEPGRLRRTAVALRRSQLDWKTLAPLFFTGLAFLVLFWQPLVTLLRDWWSDPEAGHGLVLAPLAIVLAWRGGVGADARRQPVLGTVILAGAVLIRYLSGVAAELFTMRMSLLVAAAALVIFAFGLRQLLRWWLPALLLVLSVPLPAVVTETLAFPLQLEASQIGAGLLDARYVPVQMSGNVIRLPGHTLFVTEACSGLRSLSALLSLGLLVGGLWLSAAWSRVLLAAAAIPLAMLLNGIRIFLTGYLTFYVDPRLAEGVMHYSQGWGLFVAALFCLILIATAFRKLEQRMRARR